MRRLGGSLAALALVVTVLAVAWLGRASEGQRALRETDSALARGDVFEAILAARAAAEARCPGCGAPERGFTKLASIAKAAEDKGDDATAFFAWRAARAAALATGATRERADAEQQLARIGHRMDMSAVAAGAPATAAASEERLRAALATSSVPPLASYAVLAAGGALFLFGAIRAARRGRSLPDVALAAAGIAVAAGGLVLF